MKLRANPRISLALSAILLASIPSMGWSGQSIAFTAKIGIKGCPLAKEYMEVEGAAADERSTTTPA